jgi:hypothetical protein
MWRAGLGYLAGLEVAELPAVTQARRLRELERAESQHVAARARILAVFDGPVGLAAYLRTQLTGGFFPAASLPLDLGQPTEQVPPHLRRAVIKRDRHCSFPGCTAPPVRCHVHQLIPRSQGGPTRLDNLTLLCAFHHLVVIHRWGWTLGLDADPARRRHHHGQEPRRDQDAAQPRTATRPEHAVEQTRPATARPPPPPDPSR